LLHIDWQDIPLVPIYETNALRHGFNIITNELKELQLELFQKPLVTNPFIVKKIVLKEK